MTKKDELKKLLSHKKSKTWYAEKLGITVEKVSQLLDEIRGKEEGLVVERVEENGDREVQCMSDKPLTKEEIEELYGIDNISSKLATYWNKQTPSGKYLVSALIKCTVADFYTGDKLEEKLREIFIDQIPFEVEVAKNPDEELALFAYIADDHCGNNIPNSIYGKTYTENEYKERLGTILAKIVSDDREFKEIFIVNLGDEVDGWNKQTTRGGHELHGSLSNKEQFDMYTRVRRDFYDALFASGKAEKYNVINLNNSNHSGKDLSYIVNKSLEFYIEGRYPEVKFINFDKFIDVIEWGEHVIALCHGKDESLMKSPLPLNLDAKTDLWLMEFFDKLGYSPSDYHTHTIKGDIHKYNVNTGKSGRYINVASIAGGSSWIELNFGDTRAGALIEVMSKNSPNVEHLPIWFN